MNSSRKRFYSDREGGLLAATKRLKIHHRISQPGKPVNNSVAECATQYVLHGTRTVLTAAGVLACFWKFIAP